jgi:hypothetical protein
MEDSELINLLYKKIQGVPYTMTDAGLYLESPGTSSPAIQPFQIWNQTIPSTAPVITTSSDILDLNGIKIGTKGTNLIYPYIVKYTNVLLTTISTNPYISYYFDYGATNLTDNILIGAIPFNQDPDQSYRINVNYSTDNGATFILIENNNEVNPWFLDGSSGYLTFFGKIPTNRKIYITFWRYEGTKGLSTESSGEQDSLTLLNATTNQKIEIDDSSLTFKSPTNTNSWTIGLSNDDANNLSITQGGITTGALDLNFDKLLAKGQAGTSGQFLTSGGSDGSISWGVVPGLDKVLGEGGK